nr:amino acid ABC transporter permease [Mesorhizobium loti]
MTRADKRLVEKDRLAVAASLLLLLFLLFSALPLSLLPDPIGNNARQFEEGVRTTVLLTLFSSAGGLMIGVALALATGSNRRWLRIPAGMLVAVLRGTPLLVQILFVYLGLPSLMPSLTLSAFASALLALTLNVGAYNGEVIRGALAAIPNGQTEAALALGLRPSQTLILVKGPQALRLAMPGLVNNLIALAKDSSLAYAIGVVELTNVGNRIASSTFLPVPILLTTAAVYFAITAMIAWVAGALEGRLSVNITRK